MIVFACWLLRLAEVDGTVVIWSEIMENRSHALMAGLFTLVFLLAAAVATALFCWTRNSFLLIASGMVVLWAARWVIPS